MAHIFYWLDLGQGEDPVDPADPVDSVDTEEPGVKSPNEEEPVHQQTEQPKEQLAQPLTKTVKWRPTS